MVSTSLSLRPIIGDLCTCAIPLRRWELRRDSNDNLFIRRTKIDKFRTLVSSRSSADIEIPMVDPVEAKRLASKQMEGIKAKETLKRQRRGEALNGALAMIGLTIGLVIQGRTGQTILNQLVGYWSIIEQFVVQ